ncbi:DMT family transporter [Marinobacterium arenosum]|uniref:DMT family transporter n=1 Tax=Marinobacterium arenosum TaxID=2862496 RepID=UPI001C97CE39|nr:DMT family transporter [Marinobacterium arenosum]MBY4677292.1 DMT family transporter [Marinobacterium arenosum]
MPETRPPSLIKTALLTSCALIAFAANSVLCRLALEQPIIDAASFTVIRLLSGCLSLALIVLLGAKRDRRNRRQPLLAGGSWRASSMLFLYAVTFSFAYISLDTGTGALVLFGAVQVSMILISLSTGNRLHYSEWLGVLIAFAGFVHLMLPSASRPSPIGFLLMVLAGTAWGVYTLVGRGSTRPLADTAANFIRTLPFVAILALVAVIQLQLSLKGVLLAAVSGALASAIGYIIWYSALAGLSATQAAVVQLLVPVIAALGGVIFAGEQISLRLVFSAMMILGGILIVVLGRYYLVRRTTSRT